MGRWGDDGVLDKVDWRWKKIDVLAGTELEEHAKRQRLGLWLFRNTMDVHQPTVWAEQCTKMFNEMAMRTRVGRRVGAYKSLQATTGFCTCSDRYPGTRGHRVVNLPNRQCEVLSEILDWTHDALHVSTGDALEFNQVVANQYYVYTQDVPYHSDANKLLDANPTIMSISLGPATGAFCYAPDEATEFGKSWGRGKHTNAKAAQRTAGYGASCRWDPEIYW